MTILNKINKRISYFVCVGLVVNGLILYYNLLQPVCRRLWCTSGGIEEGGCRTQHMPWADGTPCSPNGHKWCQRGSCVLKDLEQLKVVDGNWGQWKPYVYNNNKNIIKTYQYSLNLF